MQIVFLFPVSRIGHGVIWIYQVRILYVQHIRFNMNYVLLVQLQFAFYVSMYVLYAASSLNTYIIHIYIYLTPCQAPTSLQVFFHE